MTTAIEAVINTDGTVKLLEPASLAGPRRALVVILDEEPRALPNEAALLSEATLAEDWNRPEEDTAWSYLQSEKL